MASRHITTIYFFVLAVLPSLRCFSTVLAQGFFKDCGKRHTRCQPSYIVLLAIDTVMVVSWDLLGWLFFQNIGLLWDFVFVSTVLLFA